MLRIFIVIRIGNGALHVKEHPKISKFTKFDGYWFKCKAWYTFKIRELSMDWKTPVPPIHTKCTMPLGLNQ